MNDIYHRKSDKIIIVSIVCFLVVLFFGIELWQDIHTTDIQKVENAILKN